MSGVKGISNFATADDLGHEQTVGLTSAAPPAKRSVVRSWLLQDLPYITMLVLALIGVLFHLQPLYWLVLTPLFGIICIIAGWRRFDTNQGRLELIYTQVLNWFALMFTIYVLYNSVVQGVLTLSSTSLALLTLLALGTFMAGLQARVWRICAVGAILLAVVPCIGWLEQSAMILAVAILAIVIVGFVTWWISQRRQPVV